MRNSVSEKQAQQFTGFGPKAFLFRAMAKHRLVGTAQDITSRKHAETKLAEQPDAVQSRSSGSGGSPKSNTRPQSDTRDGLSSRYAAELHSRLSSLRKSSRTLRRGWCRIDGRPQGSPIRTARNRHDTSRYDLSTPAANSLERKPFSSADLPKEMDSTAVKPLCQVRWIGIPLIALIAAGHVLGILSLDQNSPDAYTLEHLLLVKSPATPAAVAIQNARTRDRADEFGGHTSSGQFESRYCAYLRRALPEQGPRLK